MEEKFRIKLFYRTALFSGMFCLAVSLLLLLNYLQYSTSKPLESQAMKTLIERLGQDPDNEQLKQDIRNLDLLARKAYFSSQWQIRTGSYILLFGAVVFAVSLRYYHALRSRIGEPVEDDRSVFRGGILTQRWILGTGTLLVAAGLGASFLTTDYLEAYDELSGIAQDAAQAQSGGQIEVIDLRPDPEGSGPSGTGSGQDAPGEAAEKASADGESSEIPPSSGKPESLAAGNFPGREEILAQHNSFRGPWGNGVSTHKNIPVDWDGASGKSIAWKKEIPMPGYNSPVLWGDLLLISGADEQSQVIFCYDRNTGELKWQAETGDVPGSPAKKPEVTEDTGLAASGLATDGRRVYAIFATGDVACFGLDGKKLWARNLGVPDNHYGYASSLLVWDGKLFIQYDSNRGGRVLALSVLNGETLWDTRRKTGISWASPILVEHKGRFQLVLSADPLVAGYDIESGKELWSVACMMGEVGPSPAYSAGMVYAANEYARLVAIDLDNPAGIVWENDEYLPEVSSPVVSGGLLFIATSYGVVACYDAMSGEKYWEKEYGHGFFSSPVIADGKVYALDMGGNMHIIRLNKEFSLAGEASLGENAYSTPAFANGKIYIRGDKHLFCIGK